VNTENAARADIGQILQQMQGRLRVKAELSVAGEAVSKSATAVTADSFLTSRALGAQQLVQAKLQSEGQLTAPMTRAGQVQLTERPVTTTPFSGAAVQLTALDTSQHANAQLHRVTEQPLAENFNTVQNQERLQRAMGERVLQMVESGKWDTEMELYPARLGTVRIRMSMENSELQLVMTSQSSAVKELLEAGLPRLRDSLQEQGIQLANSSVQQESAGQQSGSQFAQNGAASDSGSNELGDAHGTELKAGGHVGGSHDGELDTFA
jgi:flagellar hook-length control protein FliK